MEQQRYMMIACAVLARECYHCAAISENIIDIQILEQGLHDIGEEKMSSSLQQEIDKINTDQYDAILMAYGLCNNGIRNIRSKIPLVIPRAHDCITLLMGSKAAYQKYFNEHTGTFFRSSGWIERAKDSLSNPESTTKQMGMGTYEEYVEIYGEENAKYLIGSIGDHLRNYSRLTFIDTGMENAASQKAESKKWARKENWEYDEFKGNIRLLLNLMNGNWDESAFLIVEPGKTIHPSYDDNVIMEE